MKKICFYLSIFCFILITSLVATTVSAEEMSRDEYTFGDIEQILVEFLDENGYTFKVGTPEFTEFVIDQMNNDTDQKMASLENYHLFNAYFAEYLYRLSLFETELEQELTEQDIVLANTTDKTILEVSNETFSMEPLKNITLGEMKNDILQEENEIGEESILPLATNTINLTKARDYAAKYYSSYNHAYPSYSNDCTNFVSQILFAGGRSKVNSSSYATLISDTKYWFIKKRPDGSWSRSSSWTVVTDLYSHLSRTQSGYSSSSKTNIINNAKSGDVIQFKKDGADRYSHAMWVHTKASSDLQLSGHTSDYLKRSLKNITAYKTYRIVKM